MPPPFVVFPSPITFHLSWEGHPSVGGIQHKDHRKLYGPAHRVSPLDQKVIKTRYQAPCPTLPQVRFHLPPQSPHPVPLPGSGYRRGPTPLLQPVGQTQPDRLNRSPESAQVSRRPRPHHTSALRTPITPQPQPFSHTIKIGQHKTMSPHPTNLAPGAYLRPGPHIIFPLRKDLLDFRCNKEYQDSWFWGAINPRFIGRWSSPKRSPPILFTNKKGLYHEAHLFR